MKKSHSEDDEENLVFLQMVLELKHLLQPLIYNLYNVEVLSRHWLFSLDAIELAHTFICRNISR